MNSKIEKFLDAEAEHQADIDELSTRKEEQYRARVKDLMFSTENRDLELFELLDADPDVTMPDIEGTPILDRNIIWWDNFASLNTAARLQAWAELFGVEALSMFEHNGDKIDRLARGMQKSELTEASQNTITKKRIAKVREQKYGLK